eukprot:TRINITY_DN23353_c0_g1_i1.p2 TRINITY_DN23353_c0_g1~~TRINITY_DN23353_c0_g1_i1.p2  ORF type:complete len:143 (+),score=31.23 TRINITY_DN23353_c0_g1_i1:51-479(+)
MQRCLAAGTARLARQHQLRQSITVRNFNSTRPARSSEQQRKSLEETLAILGKISRDRARSSHGSSSSSSDQQQQVAAAALIMYLCDKADEDSSGGGGSEDDSPPSAAVSDGSEAGLEADATVTAASRDLVRKDDGGKTVFFG